MLLRVKSLVIFQLLLAAVFFLSFSKGPVHPVFTDATRLSEARDFCRKNRMDTGFAVFVDMGIHPGKYRLFLVNLRDGSVKARSLCCHGMGGSSTELTPEFSNTPGSNCTSLGKYRIGQQAYSRYGIHIHYKLHGLQATNNKAFERVVVLHSYSPVPEREIYPATPPLGWSLGCPVICDKTMQEVHDVLQKRKKPVLLWIYQSNI